MAWIVPQYQKAEIDRAGKYFANTDPKLWRDFSEIDEFVLYDQSRHVLSNFRAAHGFPLNALQMVLRSRARKFDSACIISQRLKRLESIRSKLNKITTKLSQMQDIGGCRAVLIDQKTSEGLFSSFLNDKISHSLVGCKNYIVSPKINGYRSYHIVYKYRASQEKTRAWEGMRIEVQIRSLLQHAWATTVEAVDLITGQNLKGGEGDPNWLRFFVLVSAAVAEEEGCPIVAGVPQDTGEMKRELERLAALLDVIRLVAGYRATIDYTNKLKKKAKWFVVRLDLNARRLAIWRFPEHKSGQAEEYLASLEKNYEGQAGYETAMLSADSAAEFARAYPNFALDTSLFEAFVCRILNIPRPGDAGLAGHTG
ncbi:MAG: RelA/SpoT domain-containing protein [Alphaproteobacteria bacterium]|nr:RelA/SpoT domain-containing protein [Alphaproteobacteria bacterium]